MNDLYYPLIGSTCFGLSPVQHQEHQLINCACTNIPMRYTVYGMMLLMMDWWQSETCRANWWIIKIIHEKCCISLIYLQIHSPKLTLAGSILLLEYLLILRSCFCGGTHTKPSRTQWEVCGACSGVDEFSQTSRHWRRPNIPNTEICCQFFRTGSLLLTESSKAVFWGMCA